MIFGRDITNNHSKPQQEMAFEDVDLNMMKAIVYSTPEITTEDVKGLVNSGKLREEDGKEIITKMEGSMFTLDKNMKKDLIHKKAVVVLATESNDPLITKLQEVYAEKNKIMSTLEQKYGMEATNNTAELLNKVSKEPIANKIYKLGRKF